MRQILIPVKQELVYSRFTAEGMQLFREKTDRKKNVKVSDWEIASNEIYAEAALTLKSIAGLANGQGSAHPAHSV